MKKSILTGLLALATCVSVANTAAAAETYRVKQDDTLWKIEKARNLPFGSMQTANPNVDPLNLQIGSIITLPDTYTAVEGETFWTIAKKLNISAKKLQAANPNVDPENIQGGTVLVLPEQKQAPKKQQADKPMVKTASGKELAYKRVISSKATAYSAAPEENGGWHGVDYFGNKLKVGTIAVDPKVIPLGSKVYITGYSFPGLPEGGMIAHATDIGGAIKHHRVDVFVPGSPQHVNKFGIQDIKIYVLK
jgi:3D (Asp-Asp-Asp) domain-containing protein